MFSFPTIFNNKLHQLTGNKAQLYYEILITIEEELLKTANIQLSVVNINNG
ncbi:MAG: aspartate 1-decarboxylase [Trichodesmium erythraeum GBRTRLIN201]|nr:aspartate 1-decarboxylase [Trichodesmium erythraeum GBRTRLIN201]